MEKAADFGLGIEVGYQADKGGNYEMFCCVSIVDAQDFEVSCYSSKFLLPQFHRDILIQGKYLGEHVKLYQAEVDEPVTNYVRELIRGRKPLIKEAIRNGLVRYLKRGEYDGEVMG